MEIKLVPPRPRLENVYTNGDKPLVTKVPHFNGDYLQASIRTAVDLLGGLAKSMSRGDSVIIKPNFNCSCATPLSTDLGVLAAVIEVLQDAGMKVRVGEMCGRADWPTEKVIHNLGLLPVLKRYGVPFINFQYEKWIEVEINSPNWPSIHVPCSMYEAKKRLYLSNMRCHSSGRFSASLKLSVGWLSPEDREIMHSDKSLTEAMIAELNLAWQPNLVIVDGRRSTVEWAGRGPYVYPNVIMASGDMVAVDAEAVRILKTYPADNRIKPPVEELGQLAQAAALGIGSLEAEIIEVAGHTRTEEEENLDPASLAVKGVA
jgi:uncharacterized protein (DUF362 family)